MTSNGYPQWICFKCGKAHGRYYAGASTFHDGDPNDDQDQCGWCGSKESLTQPRDFGHPPISARGRVVIDEGINGHQDYWDKEGEFYRED